MLKLLAEIDEFILEQSIFMCDISTDKYMIYSYKMKNYSIIQIGIKSNENCNLCVNVRINNDIYNYEEEFKNFNQFKNFFCKYFSKYLI